jgi:hypothetical protein
VLQPLPTFDKTSCNDWFGRLLLGDYNILNVNDVSRAVRRIRGRFRHHQRSWTTNENLP